MRLLILLLLPCYAVSQKSEFAASGGTSIITYVRQDSIWIGADSKITNPPMVGNKPLFKSKIEINSNIYFAFAGRVFVKNTQGKVILNAYKILNDYINKNKNIDSIISCLKNKFPKALESYISYIPDSLVETSIPYLKTHMLQLTMVSFKDKNKPYHLFEFFMRKNGKKYVGDFREIFSSQLPVYYFIGFRDHMDKEMVLKKLRWNGSQVIGNINTLINVEAENHKEHVGGRIDILLITKNGHKWLTPNPY